MNVSNVPEQDNNFTHKHELFEVSNDLSGMYLKSFLRLLTLTTMHSLHGIVGIAGNILTLIIIGKLKSRINIHILMIYLAVADIMVSCQFPLANYIHFFQ